MLEVTLHNSRQHKQFCLRGGSLVLSRASEEPALWAPTDEDGTPAHSRIEIVQRPSGVSLIASGLETECHDLPASFSIGDTRFEIAVEQADSLRRPLQPLRVDNRDLRSHAPLSAGPAPATLSRWFSVLGSLNHWATSLQELYVQAARSAVEAIGLDGGMVLRRRDDQWEIAASYLPHPELGIHYDVTALDELLASPQTWFHGSAGDALTNEPAIVVSPLKNAAGELVGAVYGYRSIRAGNARRTVRYLEAHMVELLTGAVSEGIARIEREAETDRRRVLLEQIATLSQSQPAVEIKTDEREVTLLFADLRNSTALASALEPNAMYELLSQVMECLTAAVIDYDGLVIDYYGDGLAAMWNAPADQSEHAELACRAALKMLASLPAISSDWAELLPGELQLGVGIHTGTAHVGNTGTRRRAKYGPRGMAVNLASRVEAATKQWELPLLATAETVHRLSSRFATHRVCRAQMPGVTQPVDLYTMTLAGSDPRSSAAWRCYDEALQCFEQVRLEDAATILATLDPTMREVPTRALSKRVQQAIGAQQRRRSTDAFTP